MTKAELVGNVHDTLGGAMTKKDTAVAVQAVFDTLAKAIKSNGRFSYPGFGTWNLKKRAARQGRNPRTGANIKIGASKTVGFKPAPSLKGSL
jgi:DNA-binding protein HU-beta